MERLPIAVCPKWYCFVFVFVLRNSRLDRVFSQSHKPIKAQTANRFAQLTVNRNRSRKVNKYACFFFVLLRIRLIALYARSSKQTGRFLFWEFVWVFVCVCFTYAEQRPYQDNAKLVCLFVCDFLIIHIYIHFVNSCNFVCLVESITSVDYCCYCCCCCWGH